MFEHSTQFRIHYALTDQMGVVYHGNYAQFFEIGRVEAMRMLDFPYKKIEELGIILPVVDMHTKFLRPIKYDELITIKTSIREMPMQHKMIFYGEIYNESGELSTSGTVTLYVLDAKTMKRVELPTLLKERLAQYF